MQTRASQRRCQQAEAEGVSYAGPCLLPLLQPVRHCLHPFLSANDAVRLMRAGQSITLSLLADYQFVDHSFSYSTAADMKRSTALYHRYHMRITRLSLPELWNEPLVDVSTGRSVLPQSLVALSLGRVQQGKSILEAAVDDSKGDGAGQWKVEDGRDGKDGEDGLNHVHPRTRTVDSGDTWTVLQYADSWSQFNQPIPPAALPHGLRYVLFNYAFDQPLQHGSIPDTVEVLQFGVDFDQPMEAGHLPASLTHLNLGMQYNQPLLPGVLPAGLRRLHLGLNNQQPLSLGTLPPRLQQLSFAYNYTLPIAPGVIPSSVTHLKLGDCFNQPLQPGSVPDGVVHLNLGRNFNHPLLPGVLPTSLRELVIGAGYNQPLQSASLPEGLEMLTTAVRRTIRIGTHGSCPPLR